MKQIKGQSAYSHHLHSIYINSQQSSRVLAALKHEICRMPVSVCPFQSSMRGETAGPHAGKQGRLHGSDHTWKANKNCYAEAARVKR